MLQHSLLAVVTDIPNGWATVEAAAITVIGTALMAMIGWVLRRLHRVQQDGAIVRDHVANEHKDADGNPINMRDDQDAKHAEIMDKLGQLQAVQVTQARDIGGIRQELRTLHENDTEHVRQANRTSERIDKLEHTIPPHRRRKPGTPD